MEQIFHQEALDTTSHTDAPSLEIEKAWSDHRKGVSHKADARGATPNPNKNAAHLNAGIESGPQAQNQGPQGVDDPDENENAVGDARKAMIKRQRDASKAPSRKDRARGR